MAELGNLSTEARNPASERIDEVSMLLMLQVIHAADESRSIEDRRTPSEEARYPRHLSCGQGGV